MHWSSVDEFLAMGGYGFYVWSSLGVTVLAMVGELILLQKRRKQIQIIKGSQRHETP